MCAGQSFICIGVGNVVIIVDRSFSVVHETVSMIHVIRGCRCCKEVRASASGVLLRAHETAAIMG
jgi:hypothetical protein